MRISVVIPTYNRADQLERALASVSNQSHPCAEVIVVDDGSTDNTASMMHDGHPDAVYERLPSKSNASVARNRGLELATGDIVAFLDSDDEWSPDHIKRAVEALQALPAVGATTCSFKVSSEDGDRVFQFPGGEIRDPHNGILNGMIDIRSSALVVRRHIAVRVGFDPLLEKHQDWDFATRLSECATLEMVAPCGVIMHANRMDRMSARPNHSASRYFFEKHSGKLSKSAKSRFFVLLAYQTFLSEKRNRFFWFYWRMALPGVCHLRWRDRIKFLLCIVPLGRYLALRASAVVTFSHSGNA